MNEQNDENAEAAIRLLFGILQPEISASTERLRSGTSRLIHYTSAENALSIIKSERFWLRNVRCMNDYSEIQHGIALLLRVFRENESARRERLVSYLDQIAPGATREAIADFDSWIPNLPDQTFIGCLSEFDPSDNFGRLSMWRAYSSRKAGVAIVMNSEPFSAETDKLNAYSLPVAYLTDQEFAAGIDRCLDAIEATIDSIRLLSFATVRHIVFWWILTMAVGLKHPAFVEEREWRVVYLPGLWRSNAIEETTESVAGIPQIVQKIPLRDDPDSGLIKADLDHLLYKIIIGPSEYPLVLRNAFAVALAEKNVSEPLSRISVSSIPLRSQ